MFIDTSASVALLTDAPEAAALATALERSEDKSTSPLARLETCVVLAARLDMALTGWVE